MCLSIKCNFRFWGVEHFRSQSSMKQPYYTVARPELATQSVVSREKRTYGLLPSLSSCRRQWVMALFNMQVQKSLRGEILPTLDAPIHMSLTVMYLVIRIGLE